MRSIREWLATDGYAEARCITLLFVLAWPATVLIAVHLGFREDPLIVIADLALGLCFLLGVLLARLLKRGSQ